MTNHELAERIRRHAKRAVEEDPGNSLANLSLIAADRLDGWPEGEWKRPSDLPDDAA